MATPVWCCGAECRIADASGVSGTNAVPYHHTDPAALTSALCPVDTSVFDPFGGAASFRVDSDAHIVGIQNTATTTVVARLRFNVDASYAGWLVYITGGASGCIVSCTAGGVVAINVGSGAVTIATVSTSAWHTLDVRIVSTGGTDTGTARIDGGSDTVTTFAGTSANLSYTLFGCIAGSWTAGTAYLDSMVISYTSADYPFGDGFVKGYTVNVVSGTHNQTAGDLKDETSTNITNGDNSGGKVDDVPFSDVDYVQQAVLRTTTYWEGVYATASETNIPRAVEQVVGWEMSAITAAGNHKFQLYDGTTAADVTATTTRSQPAVKVVNQTKQWATAPSTGAWTLAKFQALRVRFGFSGDASPIPRFCGTVIEAEFAYSAPSTPFVADEIDLQVYRQQLAG